jgi:hypothetical protein
MFLATFGTLLLLLTVRRLRTYRLKERYALLFVLIGLPFVGLAFWPDAVGWMAHQLQIQYNTFALICVSVFLFLIVFELLTIVSVQDQKITALAQLVAILMEKQKLAEPEHRPVEGAELNQQSGQYLTTQGRETPGAGWKPVSQGTPATPP